MNSGQHHAQAFENTSDAARPAQAGETAGAPALCLGLPVSGYRPQNEVNLALVNVNKAIEEQVLRILDGLAGRPEIDKRWLAIGRTAIENGFMAVNRSVFQPGRIALPGDVPALATEDTATGGQQDTRSRGEPRVPRHDAPAAA